MHFARKDNCLHPLSRGSGEQDYGDGSISISFCLASQSQHLVIRSDVKQAEVNNFSGFSGTLPEIIKTLGTKIKLNFNSTC